MSRRPLVLVVDERAERTELLAAALHASDFTVGRAADGLRALRLISAEPVDVLITRSDLPVLGGVELCRRLRAAGEDVPVLVLGDRPGVEHLEAALQAGADDFVAEPAAVREVHARVQALHRRSSRREAPCRELLYADVRLDRRKRRAWRGSRELELTPTELLLLEQLMLVAGDVLERPALRLRVWGFDGESNSLGVFIGRLRRKLELYGEPRLVWTVRGVGFVLDEQPRRAAPQPSASLGHGARRSATAAR